MSKMTFYDQAGVVVPGAVLLFGLMFCFPELRDVLAKDGVSVGDFGLFVLIAYAAGHLVAAIGNLTESIVWRIAGGMPSDWVTLSNCTLLSRQQIELLRTKVERRLGLKIEKVTGIDRKTWWPISRQVYAEVAKIGKPDRIDTFNGVYGLNRGLASACVALACIATLQRKWTAVIVLAVAALAYAYRSYRFGVHYARELYLQFLVLGD